MPSIIDNIPHLDSMPERIKDSDGLFYPENLRNKLFRHGNDLIYVKKSVIESLPLELINKITELLLQYITSNIDNLIMEKVKEKQLSFDEIIIKLNELETVQTSLAMLDDTVSQHSEFIDSFNTIVEDVKNKINELNKIPSEVDQKLIELYDNYKTVIENLIDEKLTKIESVIASIKPTDDSQTKKLSMKELFAMSELFSADDLVKLRQAGIV